MSHMTKHELFRALAESSGDPDKPVELFIEMGKHIKYYAVHSVTDVPVVGGALTVVIAGVPTKSIIRHELEDL